MRWRAERAPEPKDGDQRTRGRFAWLPTRVGETMVWLETYVVTEVWRHDPYGHDRWIETDRELGVWMY